MPDLYSAGGGNVFGMLSPIAWMRQAVSPWLDDPSSEYRFTEGVLHISGVETEVRQHRSEAGGWVLFAVFSPRESAQRLSLSVEGSLDCTAKSSCRWLLLSGSGGATPVSACAGQSACDVSIEEHDAKGFAHAILVTAEVAGAKRPKALTLARMSLQVPSLPRLVATVCNTEAGPAAGVIAITALESHLGNESVAYNVAAHSCGVFSKVFDLRGSDLPLHLQLSGLNAGLVNGLRRLAPVPVVDPHFKRRRFAEGIIDRDPGLPAVPDGGEFVMVLDGQTQGARDRNIYWPRGAAGVLHLRFIAIAGAAAPRDANSSLPLSIGLESWRRANDTYVHDFPRCTAHVPLGVWSAAGVPVWGGGVSDASWLVAKFSLSGFAAVQHASPVGRMFIDRLEVTAAGQQPEWRAGLPVVHC